MSPFEWITRLGEFVVELNAAKKKLVGIFSTPTRARAGGRTADKKGWVGRHETTLWTRGARSGLANLAVIKSPHQVQSLPEQARVIAQSDFCPIAGMAIGDHIVTLQGHPIH